ncbi:MAG: type II secretion system protein GspG [Aestuariibacter sp.]
MENKQESAKEPGCLGYTIGGLSFIPLIGVLFGIIAIIWGFTIKHTKLKIVGVCGIAFTIILYSVVGYFGFVQEGGVYDDLRGELTKTQLTSAVQAIEFYKVQNGQYPESLELLQKSLPENSMVFLHDAAQVNAEGKLYYYKLIDESSYHIRSYGRDGIINTSDDILPSPIENVGLVADYHVTSGL